MAETEPSSVPSIWHRLDRTLARIRRYRRPMSLVIDAVVISLCWNFTYLFRLGFERWWAARPDYDVMVMVGIVAIYLATFVAAKIPSGMWRFSGFGEVRRLALACVVAGLLGAVLVLMLQLKEVPRAVLALHPLVTLMGLCLVRLVYRMLYEHARARITGTDTEVRRTLVMGAGEAARMLLAGLHQEGWVVIGLLDDDPAKHNARILGAPVIGALDEVSNPDVLAGATHIITAMPGATAVQRRRAIELASATGLKVLTVPSIAELRDRTSRIERVRSIEPEDLLGRDPVRLDEAGIAELISGHTVLVTGAGGSIGSEICRQVALYGPARLVLYELSELALYTIEQQLSELHPHLPLVRLIGDVKDLEHLRLTFRLQRPNVVFHAAAFKHVPLMEGENAICALRNNTLGTFHAALAAAEHGVSRFVLISTDKAVNPTNVMGATKRAAEIVVSEMARLHRHTRFMAVRFGNVLGSSGSVIPKFKEQIAKGGPVTVTHPDITRYFMTIPEAARLVVQAAALGESGRVYVLDMGPPIRIVDLAKDMIHLSGSRQGEIGIVFSGLRPGEKLYEELLSAEDETLPTSHPSLRVAVLRQAMDPSSVLSDLSQERWPEPSRQDTDWVRAWLRVHVPEYRPDGLDPLAPAATSLPDA
jgi:FlaA1/EpsC-like NDP-sugar epimerase